MKDSRFNRLFPRSRRNLLKENRGKSKWSMRISTVLIFPHPYNVTPEKDDTHGCLANPAPDGSRGSFHFLHAFSKFSFLRVNCVPRAQSVSYDYFFWLVFCSSPLKKYACVKKGTIYDPLRFVHGTVEMAGLKLIFHWEKDGNCC